MLRPLAHAGITPSHITLINIVKDASGTVLFLRGLNDSKSPRTYPRLWRFGFGDPLIREIDIALKELDRILVPTELRLERTERFENILHVLVRRV